LAKPLLGYGDLSFFNMVAIRHLGFCFGRVWTAHEEYLMVVIVVQHLVGIGTGVSIICTILDFARLA